LERPPLDRTEFERWRADAESALSSAQREAAAGGHNWACFLAEQSAQLAMKGLLHGLGAAPWGHDLARLSDVTTQSGIEVPMNVKDALVRLGRHYIPSRYPDAHAAGGAARHYTASDATDALRDAGDILAFVDRTWEQIGG
jgi:HEPN domain-containing protein